MENRKRKAFYQAESKEESGGPTPGGPNDPRRKGAKKIRSSNGGPSASQLSAESQLAVSMMEKQGRSRLPGSEITDASRSPRSRMHVRQPPTMYGDDEADEKLDLIDLTNETDETDEEDEEDEEDELDVNKTASSSRRKRPLTASSSGRKIARASRNIVESSPDVSSGNETDDSEPEWTEKDEYLLQHTDSLEVALWKKTQRIFGVFPPQMIPEGIEFDFSKHKLLDFNGTKIKNPNLSHSLCDMLCQLVCCAAFQRRLDFLKYVIRYALFVRIGAPTYTKPRKSELNILHAGILEDYRKASSFEADDGALLKVLRDRLGPDLPTHYDFVKEIKINGPQYKDQPGLMKRDIMNIIAAWDRYAAKKSELKTVGEYAKDWASIPNNVLKGPVTNRPDSKQYSKERTLELKKEWIISQRPKRKHARDVDSDSIVSQSEIEVKRRGESLGGDSHSPSNNLSPSTREQHSPAPLRSWERSERPVEGNNHQHLLPLDEARESYPPIQSSPREMNQENIEVEVEAVHFENAEEENTDDNRLRSTPRSPSHPSTKKWIFGRSEKEDSNTLEVKEED